MQYHYAALQFNILNDYNKYEKQFAESLKHKRMAKYGSDYVLPPNASNAIVSRSSRGQV